MKLLRSLLFLLLLLLSVRIESLGQANLKSGSGLATHDNDKAAGPVNGSNGSSVPLEEDGENTVLERTVKIKYGQELTIKGQDLKVKFDSVLEDSRCPKDVTCVWAGDAKIVISVRRANAKASKMELHTSRQFTQAGKYQQYVIKLVALDPYPGTSVTGKRSDYVATLLIKKE